MLINGKIATTGSFIRGNEIIELITSIKNTKKKEFIFDLEIVYEDEFLAVINKPAGILVSGNNFKTIDNALSKNIVESNQPDAVKPRPTHRLDFPTTGLLLIGKTNSSILALNKLFENKKITKVYFAVTIGEMEKKGTINSFIENKESLSNYEVIQTVASKRFQFLNFIKLYPKTGRKHQLRNHLSSIGNPILGDKKYGIQNLILNGKGLYLHAFSLEFIHPFTNKKMYIEKELPAKFNKLFDLTN